MLDRSFGGVTSALLASRRSSTIAYIRGRTTSSALAGYARDFLPTARPFSSLRALYRGSSGLGWCTSRLFRLRLTRPRFDASWFGFANQNSTASAELSRFLGERNGRKPRRITAFWPSDVTRDVISVTKPNSGEFLSESGNRIL